MNRKDDLENEFPLLHKRLVASHKPGAVFITSLRERINEVMVPLGCPEMHAEDPPEQALDRIEKFLVARS